ncbi:MAG: hypothetical protein UH850_10280 [Paludibacteraceae bacterium]|nr:hypothetical protein [Paludibacteraceae bacterium]
MSKNILNKILLATLPLMAINANAATPQSFNYQSVVRSKSGSPIANQTVFVKVEILKDNLGSYEPVYSEMHNAQTNAYGSFAIKIGEGSAATGSFSGIDWSANKYVIRTSTSTNSDLTDAAVATTTMSSVPYALYSLRSADSFSGRWNDLTGKPDMSEYAKIEDVAAYSADSTRKILTDYATKDDVLDLHNRGLRSSNYRIDSLKSVVNANNYWISELQSDAAKYATKSEISSLTSKDTLSSYTSKASFNSFTKTTSETIAELSQTVDANKALAESNYKNLKEVNKLYAKKDTLDYFMSKSGMSIYATNDDLRALDRSVGSLSQSISSTDSRASELTNTVSTLSTTVADNKKEINKKIETIQTELGKVDDKILVSERKAQADDLVLNNRISANESKIKGLTDKDSVLEVKFDSQTSAFNSQIDSISKSHTAAINNLSKTVTNNATASSKDLQKKIDSLSKAITGKLDTLNINITGYVDGEVSTIENEIDGIETTLKNHASTLSSNSTSLSNLNSMVTQLVNWAQTINTKNDSLKKVLDEAKAKHKADSLKMEDRIKQDTAELRAIAKEYLTKAEAYKTKFEQLENILKDENLNTLINSKITTALSEAGLDDVNTLIENKIATALSEAGLDDINTLIDSKVATALSNAGLDDIDTLIDSKVATALSNAGLDDIKTRLKALEDKANNPGSGN